MDEGQFALAQMARAIGGPIVTVTCCRDWPVYLWAGWRNCGDCGMRPR